jgi:hypothetical protein
MRYVLIAALIAVLAGLVLAYEIRTTRPVREAVRVYSELISIGNRPGLSDVERLAAAQGLCSARYLATSRLRLGPEGGIAGLPRSMNKNFQAWRQGKNVWLCPTNRIGPVYQFVHERGAWRYDGLIAILRPRGELIPVQDMAEPLLEE